MAAKQPQRRLPFNIANAISRVGRPRMPRVTVTCSTCGSEFERYASAVAKSKSKRVFCSPCFHQTRESGLNPRRAKSPIVDLTRRHNGKPVRIYHEGYPAIYEPGFALEQQSRCLPHGWHYEHRVVAARAVGRPIGRDEQVHHRNGVKTDNRPENLVVLTRQAHKKLHNDEIAEKLQRLKEYERRYGPLVPRLEAEELRLLFKTLALEDLLGASASKLIQ